MNQDDGKGGATLGTFDAPVSERAIQLGLLIWALRNAVFVLMNEENWDILAEVQRVTEDLFRECWKAKSERDAKLGEGAN